MATLVAEGAPPTAVFDAVAAEMERLLGADGVTLSRYEPGDEVTVVAHVGPNASLVPPGTRVSHAGENVTSTVRRSKRPAPRLEHYEGTHGAIAALVRELGVRASVCSADRGRGPAVGRHHRQLARRGVTAGGHRGADGSGSPSCSTPQSRTPTAAPS